MVGVVHQAVEDAIGEGGVADLGVPVGHGELAGEDGGAQRVAVFADLQKVSPLGVVHGGHGEVVDEQDLHLSQAT